MLFARIVNEIGTHKKNIVDYHENKTENNIKFQFAHIF